MPAMPPAVNLEYELILLGSLWPSSLARAFFAASYDPNYVRQQAILDEGSCGLTLIALSGMILITFNPLPGARD